MSNSIFTINQNQSVPTKSVRVFDTTLRDGEQTPGVHLSAEQKVVIAKQLERIGVCTIEAGFPASSPGDFDAVSRIARAVTRCEVAGLARCVQSDIQAVVDALAHAEKPVVHIVLGTSNIHLEHKLGISRAEAIRVTREAVTFAKQHIAEVQFSLEDATRTERPFLHSIIHTAVEAGATRINIADTVGCALPEEFGAMIADVVQKVDSKIIVSAHCHNDMGLATANTVAAAQHGAQQVEVTVNGIGERAGNTAFEEVAVILALKGVAHTGVDLTDVNALSAMVSKAVGVAVQPNRAIVGANAFAHSSGIHQDGILKNPRNYEFVTPSSVGVAGHRFVMTAHSGRSALMHVAKDMGYALTPAETSMVYETFAKAADKACGEVSTEEIRRLIEEVVATKL